MTVDRVNAWLDARDRAGWLDGYPDRHILRSQWREVVEAYGCSPGHHIGPTIGCILALVREAYGDPGMGTLEIDWVEDDGTKGRRWQVTHSLSRGDSEGNWRGWAITFGISELDALIAALDESPA